MFLNNKYENIFKFNFAPASQNRSILLQTKKDDSKQSDNSQQPSDNNGNENKNILSKGANADAANKDSKAANNSSAVLNPNSSASGKQSPDNGKQSSAAKNNDSKNSNNNAAFEKKKMEPAYIKWKKDMVKTYDKMDPKSVAKILIKMNDNYARDILFSFKDKKRAEIIETILTLSPEAATRLTRTP
ncbi:MAG: hypothetical protein Q8858_11935 [Bacteroidota bacterium]|nr:hypothetical protein [Bacteroidota bacterium]